MASADESQRSLSMRCLRGRVIGTRADWGLAEGSGEIFIALGKIMHRPDIRRRTLESDEDRTDGDRNTHELGAVRKADGVGLSSRGT